VYSEFNKKRSACLSPPSCPYFLIAGKSGASLLYPEYRRCA